MKAYALRLPEDLHARLVDMAAVSKRSLNSEIIYRLESSTANGVTFSGGAGGTDGKAAPPPSRQGGGASNPTRARRGKGEGGRAAAAPSPPPARTEMCEHRRPAGAFCPKCDA